MKLRWLILALLGAISVSAQPQPEHRDDKYKDDPHAFCYKGPNDPDDPSAHNCACLLMCSEAPEAEPSQSFQRENPACEMYCTKSRCLCHTDNPCGKPSLL